MTAATSRATASACPLSGNVTMKAVPCPLPAALDSDRAVVRLDELFRDRQPEPKPGVIARARAVALTESIEHVRKKLRRDADAVVGDAHLEIAADRPRRHADVAARRSELQRVAQKVDEDLLEPAHVAEHASLLEWRTAESRFDCSQPAE